MDLWEQNVGESPMLAYWRKTVAADLLMMADVLGVMDILDGENLTFVVRLMKC